MIQNQSTGKLNQGKYVNMKPVNRKISFLFLSLVLVQGLHTIEEYAGRLWEVLPPARFIVGLISDNHEKGFLVFNTSLFLFGILCWTILFRMGNKLSITLLAFWSGIELINGIAHSAWAIMEGKYEPGLVTAPFLMLLSILLIRVLIQKKEPAGQGQPGHQPEH